MQRRRVWSSALLPLALALALVTAPPPGWTRPDNRVRLRYLRIGSHTCLIRVVPARRRR
jgi:hypothetical protein